VDEQLLENVHEAMRIWHCWNSKLMPVPIESEVAVSQDKVRPTATAAMFSGGVDAWFTLLSNNGPGAIRGARRIDELLCVWGLDIPLNQPAQYVVMHDALAKATGGMGAALIGIATNLRTTQWWRRADWGHIAHGCALAFFAHALAGRYSRLLIPSTHRYDDPIPWGSHPLTDHFLSSSTLQVIHDGAAFSRVEKTAAIAESAAAMDTLQVCWESKGFENCGRCSKCYRTMATLYLLGKLDRCRRFPGGSFDATKLKFLLTQDESDRAFIGEVRNLAMSSGRMDVAQAIDSGLRRSRRTEPILRFAHWLGTQPFVWRYSAPLERALRHDMGP
jgi:hypothetical protein